jgi:hypothetical protein
MNNAQKVPATTHRQIREAQAIVKSCTISIDATFAVQKAVGAIEVPDRNMTYNEELQRVFQHLRQRRAELHRTKAEAQATLKVFQDAGLL